MSSQTYYAYVWATGLVEIAKRKRDVPVNALIFACGKGQKFLNKLDAVCRHSRTEKGVLLAPGLPEKEPEHFLAWHEWAFQKYPCASIRKRLEDVVIAHFCLKKQIEECLS